MIVIDFETNTHEVGDILEVAVFEILYAEKTKKYKVCRVFHRYYFSKNPENYYSLAVHGLSEDVIAQKRKGVSYPKYFLDDVEFDSFCKASDVLIAHNATVELKHIGTRSSFSTVCCTMKINTSRIGLLKKNSQPKPPNLNEVCKYFEVPFSEDNHHSALYDVEKTFAVFCAMEKKDSLIC